MFTRCWGALNFIQVSPFSSFLLYLCKIRSMTKTASSIAYPFEERVGAYPSDWLSGESMVLIPLWEEHGLTYPFERRVWQISRCSEL
jgi:hypothetical protein